MTSARRAARVILLFVFALAAPLAGCGWDDDDRSVEMRSARKIERDVTGVTSNRWTPLPDSARSTSVAGGSVWYQVSFDRPTSQQPLGLLVPQLGDSAQIFLNGSQIGHIEVARTVAPEFGFKPVLIPMPADLLASTNQLEFRLNSGSGGLSRITVGPISEIEPVFYLAWACSYGMLVVILTASALTILLTTLLWKGTRDPLFLKFAAACAALAAYVAMRLWWHQAPIDWERLTAIRLAYHTFIATGALCAIEMLGLRSALLQRLILGYWATIALALEASAALASQTPYVATHLFGLALLSVGIVRGIGAALERATLTACLLILTASLAAGISFRDGVYGMVAGWGYGEIPLSHFAPIGFMIALGVFMIERYTETFDKLRHINTTLERRVAAAQQELARTLRSLHETERAAAVAHERQRLTRDIHDGLGSQLVATLALARQTTVHPETMVESIEACMTELRLAIDAMEPFENDLLAAIGTLRSRIEPVLRRQDIQLLWLVREIPHPIALTASSVSHVFRLVMEAFTNIVKHSQGSRATLSCCWSPLTGQTWITIKDNGRGSANSFSGGRGQTTMQHRATAVGATLVVRPRRHGTTVRLIWPGPNPASTTAHHVSQTSAA